MNPASISHPSKPRNRALAAALFRKAGAHRPSAGGERRRAQRDLQRECQAAASAEPHPSP